MQYDKLLTSQLLAENQQLRKKLKNTSVALDVATKQLSASTKATNLGLPKRHKNNVLRPIWPNLGIEAAYRRKLEQLIRAMNKSTLYWLRASFKANEPEVTELTQDALPANELRKSVRKLSRRWQKQFNDMATPLARWFASSINTRSSLALQSILKKGGVAIKFKMTSAQQDVLHATIQQNVALIKSIPQQHFHAIEGMVMRSVQTGRDLSQLTQDLQHHFGVTRRRAELIARDQSNKATSAITRVRQLELGVEEAVWVHSGGGRHPRPTHVRNSGKKFNVKTGWWDPAIKRFTWPGMEINCFPGDALVRAADIRHLWRSPFKGEMVYVSIGADLLKGTFNHPVLTQRGWVALGLLDYSDKVVCMLGQDGQAIDCNIDQSITTFVELFESSSSAFGCLRRGAGTFNFHGELPNGDVDEVSFNKHLSLGLKPFQESENFILGKSDSRVERSFFCGANEVCVASRSSCLDTEFMLERSFVQSDELIGFKAAAPSYPISFEYSNYNHCGSIKPLCNGAYAETTFIPPANLIFRDVLSCEVPSIDDLFISRNCVTFEHSKHDHVAGLKVVGSGGDTTSVFIERADCGFVNNVFTLSPGKFYTPSAQLFAQFVRIAADVSCRLFKFGSSLYEFRSVVDKRVGYFSGHVFTLETGRGYYSVGGAYSQAKNCRCISRTVLPGLT